MKWLRRWRAQRDCFHHDIVSSTKESWIHSRLVNSGAGKLFRCRVCGRKWTV